MMNRIAIMGAGSLGTILGAYISRSRPVDLIDVNKEHVHALNEKGAKVTGTIDMTVPVHALTPDELEGCYDLVIFLVKQMHNDSAITSLLPHMREDTILCTLQNGYPEPELIDRLGEDRVVGATVGWGATWIGPGVSELTSDPEHMDFNLGRIDGKITDALKETQKILSLMCTTYLTETLAETRWAKILTNAAFSGMSAALGCTYGEIMDNADSFQYLQYLVNEIIRVGVANGLETLPQGPADMRKLLEFTNNEERLMRVPVYEIVWGPHRLLRASMLQDLEKGRKCEIDAINGVVSQQGLKKKVKTPFCDKVIEIVKGIENGQYVCSMVNLPMLTEVLQVNRY